MESVHAHTVLEWIASHEYGVKADRVIAWSDTSLGENVVFHTCSRSEMGIRELLEFFVLAGKVSVEGGRLCLDRSRMCSH